MIWIKKTAIFGRKCWLFFRVQLTDDSATLGAAASDAGQGLLVGKGAFPFGDYLSLILNFCSDASFAGLSGGTVGF